MLENYLQPRTSNASWLNSQEKCHHHYISLQSVTIKPCQFYLSRHVSGCKTEYPLLVRGPNESKAPQGFDPHNAKCGETSGQDQKRNGSSLKKQKCRCCHWYSKTRRGKVQKCLKLGNLGTSKERKRDKANPKVRRLPRYALHPIQSCWYRRYPSAPSCLSCQAHQCWEAKAIKEIINVDTTRGARFTPRPVGPNTKNSTRKSWSRIRIRIGVPWGQVSKTDQNHLSKQQNHLEADIAHATKATMWIKTLPLNLPIKAHMQLIPSCFLSQVTSCYASQWVLSIQRSTSNPWRQVPNWKGATANPHPFLLEISNVKEHPTGCCQMSKPPIWWFAGRYWLKLFCRSEQHRENMNFRIS